MLRDHTRSEYRPGQLWRYRARPGEESSTVAITKVEEHRDLGVIVHVSVAGLHLRSPQSPGGATDRIAHMPFSIDAVRRSVSEKVGDDAPVSAEAMDGYAEWRRAFEEHKGGIFTVSVAEAISYLERAINQ